jgi:hypothetical protein
METALVLDEKTDKRTLGAEDATIMGEREVLWGPGLL